MQNKRQTKPRSGQMANEPRKPCFRGFILYLAEHVGRQHIPVLDRAQDIHSLLGADAVHHEVVKQLVRQIYKANGCGHLDATITPAATFNALGAVRQQLVSCQFTDIDQINFIDDVGDAARNWFRLSAPNDDQHTPGSYCAEIIPLPRTGSLNRAG